MWQLGRILNIELTSKCALKCIRCERTVRGKSLELKELSLKLIQKRLTAETLANVQFIDFSGNFGDGIYHSQFVDVIRYFKSLGKTIYLETNGTGRATEWWEQVTAVLDNKDWITFSIDGLEDTNHLYRVGSKWPSVMDAVSVCSAAPVNLTWKTVIFKHNEHQLDDIKNFALEKKFNRFVLVRSGRFKKDSEEDFLRPSSQFRAHSSQKEVVPDRVQPRCQREPLFFISASAHLYPCCWSEIASAFEAPEFLENKDELSLESHHIDEILQSRSMETLLSSFQTGPSKLCLSVCPMEKTESKKVRTLSNKEVHTLHP